MAAVTQLGKRTAAEEEARLAVKVESLLLGCDKYSNFSLFSTQIYADVYVCVCLCGQV